MSVQACHSDIDFMDFCRKNKSFRPRDRPKKGLKNLQTVKTLSAGQNLVNSTTIKTRKQPLTVTAQFQNSLSALMDTLNQVKWWMWMWIDGQIAIIVCSFSGESVLHSMHQIKFRQNFQYIRRCNRCATGMCPKSIWKSARALFQPTDFA